MAMEHLAKAAEAAGRNKSNPEALARMKEKLASSKFPERIVVEGATVVCTQMYEPESKSKMKKTDTSNAIALQGAYKLVHTDIEFEPKFEKCRYCGPGAEPVDGEDYQECEPEIDNEEWEDYAADYTSNGGHGILKEESFMVWCDTFLYKRLSV